MRVDVRLGSAPPDAAGVGRLMVADYDVYLSVAEAEGARVTLRAEGRADGERLLTPADPEDPAKGSLWRGSVEKLRECGLGALADEAERQMAARLAAANAG